MKALKEFDYNLWTTEENGVKKYFVGVKATGEVTEVDAEVMKVLLVCGCCGGAYKRTCKNETDKKVYYWRCINRIDHGTTACRDSFGIEEKKLHSAILRCLSKMMSDREEVVRLIQSNLQYGISGNAATLDVYNLENQIVVHLFMFCSYTICNLSNPLLKIGNRHPLNNSNNNNLIIYVIVIINFILIIIHKITAL